MFEIGSTLIIMGDIYLLYLISTCQNVVTNTLPSSIISRITEAAWINTRVEEL